MVQVCIVAARRTPQGRFLGALAKRSAVDLGITAGKAALQDIDYMGEFMFEAVAPVSLEDTLEKTAAFPKEFVLRYGG